MPPKKKKTDSTNLMNVGPVESWISLCDSLESRNKELLDKTKELLAEHNEFKERSFIFKTQPSTMRIDMVLSFYDQIQKNHVELIEKVKEVFEVLGKNMEGYDEEEG